MGYIRKKLSSNNIIERTITTAVLFSAIFFGGMIISYFLLPEGLLKNKNPLMSWDVSDNSLLLALQILFYNLLSVVVIIAASLFGSRKTEEENYLSAGYTAFFTLIAINSVVLGTWSFSVETEAVPLLGRIAGVFDLAHRAGLWEMAGQLLITCAVAHISIIQTGGNLTTKRKIRDIRLTNPEKAALIAGFALMIIGAVVESISISNLQI